MLPRRRGVRKGSDMCWVRTLTTFSTALLLRRLRGLVRIQLSHGHDLRTSPTSLLSPAVKTDFWFRSSNSIPGFALRGFNQHPGRTQRRMFCLEAHTMDSPCRDTIGSGGPKRARRAGHITDLLPTCIASAVSIGQRTNDAFCVGRKRSAPLRGMLGIAPAGMANSGDDGPC